MNNHTTTVPSKQASTSSKVTFDQVRQSAAAAGLPVARMTGERTASIPSATTPGVEYTVWIQDGGAWAVCECPDGGAHCWHGQRAVYLWLQGQRTPAPAVTSAAIIARGQQASDDLFGAPVQVAA